MKNVGVSALTAGLLLTSADENLALNTVNEIKNAALARLKTEFALSQKSIADGHAAADEKHIVETWGKYYVDAVATIANMPVAKNTDRIDAAIKAAAAAIANQTKTYLDSL